MEINSAFAELERALQQSKNELVSKKAKRDLHLQHLQEIEERWSECNNRRDLLDKVRVLLQISSEHARLQAKQQLETLVTNALQYVFGSAFRFEIELSDHGGNPTADFYVVTEWEGQTIKNKPQDSRGGGIVDVVSLALRIALIETVKPRLPGPIILDEPGKHVSEDYIVPMIEFLKSVGETFGRQIILVTHNTDLTESADTAYHVRLSGGKSEVQMSRYLDNGIA
ncbi:ATP-binding protein [Paenactinomyces guangxiensis]|uniref:ATP-binding protein n=1 Tax=Paenactinomyces guangxiensis TaxID=1490290 RepID=A0A7W2A8P6_9BACL|nr:ATP-binding protein [Paenactinomyces guangxiensis]MBA4494419.1 ATP-binding protein [Paenactinomyces guangxiensis]MBH8591526.1 ATP-binding protein [Paenactinomyces guangxiensis]